MAMCLRYILCISAPFRSGISCRSSADPTLHFACITSIHLSTARFREILISISQAHSFRFPQALFQRISNGIYLFLRRVCPNWKENNVFYFLRCFKMYVDASISISSFVFILFSLAHLSISSFLKYSFLPLLK